MTRPLALTRRRFLATAAAGGLVMLHPFSARAQAGQAHLRVISTTDLHCNVQPYDYYADKPVDTVGLARTGSIIEAIRAEATNTLLVDNGDYLQGNPMGDYIAYKRGMKAGDIHPVIAGMNTLAYEVGTLGNHEFNYGVEFLDLVNAGAEFPIVCANFASALGASPREDKLHLKPYVILERTLTDGAGAEQAIKVGLIGFVPPQIMLWDRGHLEGKFADPRHPGGGARLGAGDARGGRGRGGGAQPFRHRRDGRRDDGGERLAAARRGRRDRRHRHRAPAPGLAVGGFLRRGHRPRRGHAQRQAGHPGRVLGLAHGADRPPARAGRRRLEGRRRRVERAADLRAQRGPEHHRPGRRLCPGDRGDGRGARGDARVRARRGRHLDGAVAVLLRGGRRRPLGADREPGADLVRHRHAEGHRVGGAADPLRRRAVQVGRARRAGVLHRRAGGADRDQERGRRLPLPQHAAGGGDHRGAR